MKTPLFCSFLAISLAWGAALESVVDPGSWVSPKRSVRIRGSVGAWVLPDSEGALRFKMRYVKIGQALPQLTLSLTDPQGVTLQPGSLALGEEKTWDLATKTQGAHFLELDAGASGFTLTGDPNPLVLDASKPVHFYGGDGLFYLWVPPQVQAFTIFVRAEGDGEGAKAELRIVDGESLGIRDDIGKQFVELCGSNTGNVGKVATLRVDRPSSKDLRFEDYFIQVRGIAPFLAWTRESLLKAKLP
jgi:hypothetical protein